MQEKRTRKRLYFLFLARFLQSCFFRFSICLQCEPECHTVVVILAAALLLEGIHNGFYDGKADAASAVFPCSPCCFVGLGIPFNTRWFPCLSLISRSLACMLKSFPIRKPEQLSRKGKKKFSDHKELTITPTVALRSMRQPPARITLDGNFIYVGSYYKHSADGTSERRVPKCPLPFDIATPFSIPTCV